MQTRTLTTLAVFALAVLVGHIADATTGQPMPGITVTLSGAKARATKSGAGGAYRFANVEPGKYVLTIVSSDVPTHHQRVVVRGKTTVVNISACSTTLDYSCAGSGPGM